MAVTPTSPPPSKSLTLARRSVSTLSLWALVAAAFASMQMWVYLGLIALLTVVATLEYFRMLNAAGVKCFPRFGLGLAIIYCGGLYAGLLGMAGCGPDGWDVAVTVTVICGSFILQLRDPVRGSESLVSVMATLCGFVYVALLFNFAAKLFFVVPAWRSGSVVAAPAVWLVLWLLAVTKFTDMGAYLVGSMIGRHKMIPHVSPAKTWEGFGGAILFSQIAGCGLYAISPARLSVLGGWGHVVFLGFLLAVLAVLGDLAESVVKRALGAKDSGHMLPGIGGAMDLIDSVCFTAPALYFYLQWVLLPTS